ncbi:MAG: Rrf2 family transcriptional regulator [Deltaproteobacteria bacterium]|nr:Rrf2 family transcriptional regulator [Deltaproteobacteria bacterium]
MKMSTRGRYAVRAMLDLAINWGQGPINLKEMSRRQDISVKYLEQIFIPLKAAALIRSTRGPSGGYTLARAPEQVTLGEIITAIEGPVAIVDCVQQPEKYPRSQTCVTFDVWKQISEAISTILDRTTLSLLVTRHQAKVGARSASSKSSK